MSAIASTPGAARLFVSSILGRVPLAMLSIGLLVHTEHATGSFGAAGLVTAAYAVALGVVGPLLGQLVDRRGQTAVLLLSALASTALLAAIALAPPGTPLAALVALATGIGAATPPLGACLRALLPAVLPDAAAVRDAYAVEATASELAWVSGPPLALGMGALWSTGAALTVAGLVLLAGTAAFALQPVSRGWRPATGGRPRGGSLRTPAMRTLVTVLVGVGVLFGGVEVAVAAATDARGSTAAAGPLLALWGAGSLLGGLLAVRLGGVTGAAGLAVVLAALAAGHLALVPAAGNLVALGAVLLVAGAAIAPTYALVYAMVDHAAPEGTVTEAFAWLATAIAIGASVGAAGAGAVADHAGPGAAFALAGAAGTIALLAALLRSPTLAPPAVALAAARLADSKTVGDDGVAVMIYEPAPA
jgi:predicted MFS family arabinose efflux permease